MIAVVGDYRPDNQTHTAIAEAVAHASSGVDVRWVGTDVVARDGSDSLAGAAGVWVASGSPYKSFDGALEAIRWARTKDVPLLGTCGGFQHAVIEFARNVAGIEGADHAEYESGGSVMVVDALACSLAGQTMDVTLIPGSRAHAAYGRDSTTERYYCSFGLNPTYTPALVDHGLIISGTDPEGEPRIIELPDHPFFVATLFVPQTSSTPDRPHPLVAAFVGAAVDARSRVPLQ